MSSATAATEGFNGWAILEVFGHRKLGGRVQVNPPEMPGMVRIDVIAESNTPLATQYYGPTAIFCMTPATEETARRMAKASTIRPVQPWELPALESRPVPIHDDEAFTPPDDDDDIIDPTFDVDE